MRSTGRVPAALAMVLMLALPGVTLAQDMPAPTPPAEGELAFVLDVIDGDTIRVDREGGSSERVRYIGIDTPETVHPDRGVEPWGPEASTANRGLVGSRLVLLERDVSDRDQYDRLLRYVWVEQADGWVMVNGELVAKGLAEVHAYEPDTAHQAWLSSLETSAREAGLGIHGSAPPSDDEELDLVQGLLDLLFGS